MSKSIFKVAHLTSLHSRYDTRIFIKMCSSLAANGYDVSLVVADDLGDEVKNGVSIVDVGATKTGGRLSRMTITVKRVFEKAKELDTDIYHFHDPELIPNALKLKDLNKIVIFDIHENTGMQILSKDWMPFYFRKLVSIVYEKYESYACKKFDMLIVPQLSMQENYQKQNSTELIGNFPHISDVPSSFDSSMKSRYRLLYSGGLGDARGLFNMLDLILELKHLDIRYSLELFGPLNNKSLQKARMHEGWQHTNYLGVLSKEQVYEEYLNNSIGLILLNNVGQYYMAYSLKLFEYMMFGMCIIMPNFGEWVPFNRKYQVGINVPVDNPKFIAKKIHHLSDDEFYKYGSNGIRLIESEFNWEKQNKTLIHTYDNLIDVK